MVCCSAPFVIGGELLPCGSCLACREVARELVEPLLSYVSALPEGCAVCGLPVMPGGRCLYSFCPYGPGDDAEPDAFAECYAAYWGLPDHAG